MVIRRDMKCFHLVPESMPKLSVIKPRSKLGIDSFHLLLIKYLASWQLSTIKPS
jgi:hypothetical protein